jgi:putative DNA primase/helicase
MRLAKATVEAMLQETYGINDQDKRNRMLKHALLSQKATQLRNMVGLAESESEVVLSPDKIDANPLLLGVKNGVIDLQTGTFREARREDLVSKIAGCSYDEHARCPNWDAFLLKIFDHNEELIRYIQRVAGYMLTGLTVEEVLFVMWGLGANGKSTFRETIFALLGDYAIGADASLLITNRRQGGATPDLARLFGRRLVTVNETEDKDHLNESRIKFITSNDVITARNLHESFFDFKPTHKTILTTNHKPIVRGTDEGIWRRIQFLPFTMKIPDAERDKHFREKQLMPELSGILNRALEGLREYHRIGLSPPNIVLEATKEYRDDMDLIGNWIEERCELDPNSKIQSKVLYSDYVNWARDEIGFTTSAISFGRDLVDRGFKRVKKGRNRAIRGLNLRPLPDRTTEDTDPM